MKVLKFGGASVGSIENLQNVKKIVDEVNDSVVIVVSAVDGVTDWLFTAVEKATVGDATYVDLLQKVKDVHYQLIEWVISSEKRENLTKRLEENYFQELEKMLKGVFLLKESTFKSTSAIVSYGELLSSEMLSDYLDAKWFDSRELIKTYGTEEKILICEDVTFSNLKKNLKGCKRAILGGYIASGELDNYTTLLGRGGTDQTATVVASALGAKAIELWNPGCSFMTADPKVISKAYEIEHLSYEEALEFCSLRSGVVDPQSIYFASQKSIPIYVKNIEDITSKGTIISDKLYDERTIKGISSLEDTTLVTLYGQRMCNCKDLKRRIFRVLDELEIESFFVSQALTETSITVGIYDDDADNVVELLEEEFELELKLKFIDQITCQTDLATIAIIGENMKRATGTSGKLFDALGRNNINVIAVAQGSSETNISCVVKKEDLRKALNAIHESFFLSDYQELNLFVVGTGTVGGSLLEQLHTQKELLMSQNSLKVKVIGIADVANFILDRNGIDLTCYNELLKNGIPSTPDKLKNALIDLNIYNCVFVDCTASPAIAGVYKDLLLHNISVVAANKIAASGDYDNYMELKNIARKKGIKYLFETNVGAGLPIINTINDLIYSGDRILKLEAVLSGTLNFIFNTISAEIPLSKAIRMAMEARFAEPDPRIDLSGKDVIRKLVILARESGLRVEQDDVEKNLFIPNDFFEGSLDDFWAKVESFDAEFEEKRKVLEKENKRWRFVAKLEDGKTSVGLVAVDSRHPFYDLEGSNNLIIINTARYKDPMMIRGYGAGAAVTAAGVFADIISIANVR